MAINSETGWKISGKSSGIVWMRRLSLMMFVVVFSFPSFGMSQSRRDGGESRSRSGRRSRPTKPAAARPLRQQSVIWAWGDSLTTGVLQHRISPSPQKGKVTKIVNRTGFPIRVHVFNRGDKVRGVARMNFILKTNASRILSRNGSSYLIKVFKSQLIDKLLTSNLWVAGTTTITRYRKGVRATTNSPTQITNQTTETIKVCIYGASDKVQAIPMKVWTIAAGKTVTYAKPAAGRFRVSMFRPGTIDRRLATRVVGDRCRIYCREVKNAGGYPEELSKQLGGRYKVVNKGKSGEPLSFAANHYHNSVNKDRASNDYGLDRLRREMKKKSFRPPALVLICQGANDRVISMRAGRDTAARRRIEAGIKSDLARMIIELQRVGSRVVVVSQPQEEPLTVDLKNLKIGVLGIAPAYYASVGRRYRVPVDNDSLPSIFRSTDLSYRAADGRHLSAKGNQRFAANVARFLRRQNIVR